MRRGSATIYSLLNTSHIKAVQNIIISKRQTPNHILNSPIKKAVSLNSNIKDLLKVLKKNNNVKSKFTKDNKNIPIDNNNKINNINNIYQKISPIKIDIFNKFISLRKMIYKKTIIEKYFTPYLNLKLSNNDIYTKESEIPRLFHIYYKRHHFLIGQNFSD